MLPPRPQLQRDTAQLAKITNSSIHKISGRMGELDEVSLIVDVWWMVDAGTKYMHCIVDKVKALESTFYLRCMM